MIVDRLDIFAGQRYSVVVTADQPVANYCEFNGSHRVSP